MKSKSVSANLHVYPTPIEFETRIFKETKSLIESGAADRIYIAGIHKGNLEEREFLDERREIWRVPLRSSKLKRSLPSQILKTLEWTARIVIGYRNKKVTLINCHAISVLPIGIIFKVLYGSKIIYDTHEIETEKEGLHGFRQKLAKAAESLLIRYVDAVFVVGPAQKKWYEEAYGITGVVPVRNVPYFNPSLKAGSSFLKEKLGLDDSAMLFIFQGIFAEKRGLEILLEAFARNKQNKHVVFMGYGELEDLVKAHVAKYENIHFIPPVPPSEVIRYTSGADVGVVLYEHTCLNNYYCLPNKFFEYLVSGLPVIASRLPEMAGILDEHNCGWTTEISTAAFSKLLEKITFDDVAEKKKAVLTARPAFDWNKEVTGIVERYGTFTNL